ncbi:U11/U12 small nuclear ribonucleoprotein 48 kDa protein isoform X2 [Calliopsis andreniformis]
MLNYTLNQREYRYQKLNDFTKNVRQEIIDITCNLGWTVRSIEIDNDNHLVCLYNSSHRIGKKMLDHHLESCQWKKEGYNEFDIPLSDPSLPVCSPSSIKLDVSLQNNILQEANNINSTMKFGMGERLIPRTSDRIFADFTQDERKTLYEYVVSNTVNRNVRYDITDTHKLIHSDGKEDKKLSFIELLVQERNLKRRRAKHRGVHTNKKSHTEILRELINQQMELYTDCVTETCAINHGTKTVNKHLDDTTQNSSISFGDSSLKSQNFCSEDSQEYRKNSKAQSNEKYKQFRTTKTLDSKDREKQDKFSQSTTTKPMDLWETQELRKRKTSRSKEHNTHKRNKHCTMQQNCKKDSIKFRESFDSNYYSKYTSNRR